MLSGINGMNGMGSWYPMTRETGSGSDSGNGENNGNNENTGGTNGTEGPSWDGSYYGGSVSSAGGTMSMTDFYTLLAAQLRYQDADNPMDTSEMMAQMVQSQMIQTITQLSEVTITTYAASMAGKEVTVAEVDEKGQYTGENTVGVVESVVFSGGTPILFVNGKGYYMSQLMAIGKVPETENPEKPGEGEGTEKPGEGEGTEKPGEGEGTEKPGEGGDVTNPDKPGEGGDTTNPDKPGEGGDVTNPDKPGEGGDVTNPDKPGGDGSTTDPDKPDGENTEGSGQPEENGEPQSQSMREFLQRRTIIL